MTKTKKNPKAQIRPTTRRSAARCLALLLNAALCATAGAQSLAPQGCPISHCTPASIGVIGQPLTGVASVANSNSSLGSLHAEGCSGNGTRLYCLFLKDHAAAARKGTLKALDATSLKALWGSAAASDPDLDPNTAAIGQVPTIFADGSIAAGDGSVENHYSKSGELLAQLPLSGRGTNFGLIPISQGYAVVSQGNGTLTVVNLATWQNVGSLALLDPVTNDPVNLIGPASASQDALYVVAYDDALDLGILYSIVVDQDSQQLNVRSTFRFIGRSGAKPVFVSSDVSGLNTDLVLLAVPGLIGDDPPQNRILGVTDSGAQLAALWSIPLTAPLAVSPTVDGATRTLFYESGFYIRQSSLVSGAALQTFNLKAIGAFPPSFRLNGHIGGSSASGALTLLLSGGATVPAGSEGEYVMLFQPLLNPSALLWNWKIANQPATYSGAYNFGPAAQPGVMCPVAISITAFQSTLTRICDH